MPESAIVKYLCGKLGSTNREELVANLDFGDVSTVNEIISNRDRFANAHYNGEKRLIAKTALRLCRRLVCAGPGCSSLHLCKTYLYGECQFVPGRRAKCSFSHDLHSEHNARLLRTHGLEDLDKKEICVLLLQNDMALLPDVCFDYNNTGCRDGCKRIHICEQYLRRNCCCSRAHDFYEPQPFEMLQKSRIPNDLMASMKQLYINKKVLSSIEHKAKQAGQANQVPGTVGAMDGAMGGVGGAGGAFAIGGAGALRGGGGGMRRPPRDKTEICLYFLKGTCRNPIERCFRAHCRLPYSWEVLKGHQWTLLDSSEKIEEDYCDPKKTYSTVVCFDTMLRGLQKVRRLSSISSVLQPTFLLTTEWLWYWEDEDGNWNQYDSPTNSSTELEQKFQNNPQEVVEFTAGSHAYTLSLQDMIQTNKRHGTKRLVRRRPRFLSSADVLVIRTRRPPNGPTNFQAMPRHWDRTQVPETGHKKVLLQDSSEEYKEVETLFRKTMTDFDIVKIERIQNKSLWDQFQLQREQMKTRNGGRCVAERKLFHGTDSKYIDAICCSNFDWRICGTHGTSYGNGSYFARDASYSHNYTGNASTVRSMFVSRVLVGHHTRGKAGYVRPPSKDGGDALFYDSCVNDILSPSIFVVFDRPQIYPEFLLTYKERREKVSVFDDWRRLALTLTAAPVVKPTPVPRAMPLPSATPVPGARRMPSTTRVPSATLVSNATLLQKLTDTALQRATIMPSATPVPSVTPVPRASPMPSTTRVPSATPVSNATLLEKLTDMGFQRALIMPRTGPVPRAPLLPSAPPMPSATPMPSTTHVPSAMPVSIATTVPRAWSVGGLTPPPVYTPAYVKPTPPPQFYVPKTSRHPFQPPAPDLP
ncbi:protein mono-ADP-ribosyltransferase PARP12 isoform X2 [Gadus morhua]|uniref:protein mono-ADP-ribosyltransferase PARP12 isoform X2 n=1 Tax=Gadus morhua TaxID=8049 RepID=UPI0011B7D02B|nr:protein mono-ADP-ribosyltransferase PARP12-like isoform X2 [Gadus morhua]